MPPRKVLVKRGPRGRPGPAGSGTAGVTQAQGDTRYQKTLGVFNVKDYGAVGNGVTDDTAAFQACFSAAIAVNGKVVIPPTANDYIISDTILLQPPSGIQFYLDIEGHGASFHQIRFTASNKPVFKSLGWKGGHVQSVRIRVTSTKTNVIAWEIDADTTYNSTGQVVFDSCRVTTDNNTVTGITGWRLGHSSTGQDVSFFTWYSCAIETTITGQANPNTGWQIEGQNSLHFAWYNCGGTYLDKVFTNVPSAGGHTGGNSCYFSDCGGSFNVLIYELKTAGAYKVDGGRWELCQQLLNVPNGGASLVTSTIVLKNLTLNSFTPLSNRLIYLGSAVALTWEQSQLTYAGGVTPTSQLVYASTGSAGYGSLRFNQLILQDNTADPFYTIASGDWDVALSGVIKMDSSGLSTARFPLRSGSVAQSPTTPEGGITAPPGWLATRSDFGGAYVKESGVSNTGWALLTKRNRFSISGADETMDRHQANSGQSMTTQTLRLSYFTCAQDGTANNIVACSGGTAAGATPTLVRYGLYTVAANGDITLVASTANDTAIFVAANTEYSKALSSPYARIFGQRYAIGILVVTAAATPTVAGTGTTASATMARAPRLCAIVTSQADLPSSVASASIANSSAFCYAALL